MSADWYANPARAAEALGWHADVALDEGLRRTARWYAELADVALYERASKKRALDSVYSVTAIIACYKDGQAIPIMDERLKGMFNKLDVDYEIIFVNDGSPDDSEEAIRAMSAQDPRIVGISHSRNFGSQAAFRSGMEIATKNAGVLMDGDLQDPPELIPNSSPNGGRATTSCTAAHEARGAVVHADRLQGVLPGIRLLLIGPHPARRGRFLADRPAGGQVAARLR